jgi:iron(III) transport system substrate-binding protein
VAGLGALALLAATMPAVAPSPMRTRASGGAAMPPFAPDVPWREHWEAVTAAAEREGTLSLMTVFGGGYGTLVERFRRAFPSIALQHVPEPTINGWLAAARRVKGDRTAAFDVGLIHSGRALTEGRSEHLWTPLRPLLFRPDVLDDGAWRGGTAARFMDNAGELCFAWEYQLVHTYAINTDIVAQGEITSAADLLQPKWKGRILSSDPRVGIALLAATSVARAHGHETLARLLVDQRPVLMRTESGVNITESLARGDYPIALGVRPKALNPLRAKGLGHNVAYLDLGDADFVATNLMFVFARAAHPAAATVFVNWMLTQDAQTLLTNGLHTNSARIDVPPSEPDGVAVPGRSYYEPERETNNDHAAATERFIRGLALGV